MKQIFFGLLMLLAVKSYAGPVEELEAAVGRSGLDARIERVVPSPMTGLYQVELQGGRVLYGSPDGRYLIQGYLFEVQEKGVRNLTAEHGTKSLATLIAALPEEEMVIFPAAQPKAQILVFTDTECPFCHKLHEDIEELNELGITVHYLAYPRQGLDTSAYKTLVKVWCAEDRREAMNDAIDGDDVDAAECANPVAKQYELGRSIGIQGTPAIVLQSGQMITGYRAPKDLAKAAIEAGK